MQVDPTPMNVGDGGTVSREISAPSKASASMVGNPPQTLPPELRGDVSLSQQNKSTPTTDSKTAKACLDSTSYNHSPEVPSPQQLNNAPVSAPSLTNSDKRADKKTEVPKLKADGPGIFPTAQWAGGAKISLEDSLSPSHSNVTSSKKLHTPTHATVMKLAPGLQGSTIFKPSQSVAFLPSTNFSSPVCKITLPPALGQIAALRDATVTQFQKEIQPQSSSAGGTSFLRTYPYPFSVGRTPGTEKKASTSTSKLKSNSTSNKSTKSVGEHKSLASVVASPAIALPLQHPSLGSAPPTRFTMSPTAVICCGPALASITTQSRLLNHVEKSHIVDKTSVGCLKPKAPSASEDHAVACPIEPRDVPLDLSAKSKRPKCVKGPPNPAAAAEHHYKESNQRESLNAKRPHVTTFSSAVQYPVLPNTHRNGSHQKQSNRASNHQVLEPKSSWTKGSSQDSIKSIPGTYVGVASPILASTLRGKDGKGNFADEFQNFAKQEFISIIDQGEHLASRGKKPSYLMKGNQHSHSIKHVNSISPAITSCPSKGALTSALLGSATPQIHPKSGSGKATVPYSTNTVSPAWQQSAIPNQGVSVQRKVNQGSPKVKVTPNSGGPKFQSGQPSTSKREEDKWERIKSPLSNLESIVKQKTLETTAMIGEGYAQTVPVASRKADAVTPHIRSQDTQSKQASTFEYPPFRSVEKKEGKQLSVPSQGDSSQILNRLEKSSATEPSHDVSELNTNQGEHMGLQDKQGASNPASQSHMFGGNASTNGNRMESKLAQVLEGEIPKKDCGAPETSPSEKSEGMVLSILTGQSAGGSGEAERKANGTKEEPLTKAKVAVVRQKKVSPKKPAKEKSPSHPPKKAAGTSKKRQDKESPQVKVANPRKKKQCAYVQEQSLSSSKLASLNKEEIPKEKSSPNKLEQAPLSKPVSGSDPKIPEAPVSLKNCGIPSKEPKTPVNSTPRLRRGRRRADEAQLDHWGFATPSPPPSLTPPPLPSPPPPTPPSQPTRRPRGRPRTNPLPDRGGQGKARTPSGEGESPVRKKRRRCRNRKYQTGDYITEKDKVEDGERNEGSDSPRQDNGITTDSQTGLCPSLSPPRQEAALQRSSLTRSGSVRYQENEASPGCIDKPSGKRKFKSKHLCDSDDQKSKTKRSNLGKRSAPSTPDNDGTTAKKPASISSSPKVLSTPPSNKKGSSGKGGATESTPKRPVPPEVRRLIVNKNAGETLLQRAARLGYQDVVLYCLEKDVREVNRRDNAGYTALHEASSRGWTQIVEMLLNHGADVNCSAQDGTRPIHDAVASDNLPIVWLLLSHGADPTLATYSGHTAVKLAHSQSMKTFLTEYFTDLDGRSEQDPCVPWEFYSSTLFENDQEPCWDFLLFEQKVESEEKERGITERDSDKDCLLFEFSSEPLLPCYHVQVSLSQGFCNWFLLTDVLKRLKMSARIFRARYPHLEVVSLGQAELWRQVSVSQVSSALAAPHKGSRNDEDQEEEDEEGPVELVRCVPELQRLLGSSIHILHEEEEIEEEEKEVLTSAAKPRSR